MGGAGEILRERGARRESNLTAHIGMLFFLASWGMLFAGLFFAFGLARVRAEAWPPPGVPAPPVMLPAFNTAVIAASSIALVLALRRVAVGSVAGLTRWLGAAALLGCGFVVLQVMLWTQMWTVGLTTSTGQYGSLFYGLTWVHAAHVGIGILGLGWLVVRSLRGAYSPERHTSVTLWSWYWHFVGVAWLAMYVMLFLS